MYIPTEEISSCSARLCTLAMPLPCYLLDPHIIKVAGQELMMQELMMPLGDWFFIYQFDSPNAHLGLIQGSIGI